MALPLAIPVLAGAAGALGLTSVLGGGKKSLIEVDSSTYSPQYQNEYHQPYETFQPVTVWSPQQTITMPSYQVSMYSPGSHQASSQETKADQKVDTTPYWYQPSTTSQEGSTGAGISNESLILIALIGAGAIVAYGVLQ